MLFNERVPKAQYLLKRVCEWSDLSDHWYIVDIFQGRNRRATRGHKSFYPERTVKAKPWTFVSWVV